MGFPLKQAPLYVNVGVAELEKFCSDAAWVQVDGLLVCAWGVALAPHM
jgi:hypothetical protein